MRDLHEGIESGAVVDALRRRWKVDVDVAEYAASAAAATTGRSPTAPAGGGLPPSTISTTRPGSAIRAPSSRGATYAFDTSVALRERGLNFVLAPILTPAGESLLQLDDRYTIALFPFVAGEPGTFGRYDDDEDRLGVSR